MQKPLTCMNQPDLSKMKGSFLDRFSYPSNNILYSFPNVMISKPLLQNFQSFGLVI